MSKNNINFDTTFDELPEHSIDELIDVMIDVFRASNAHGPYYSLRVKKGLRVHFVEPHMRGRKAARLNVNIAHNNISIKIFDLITQKFHKRIKIIKCDSFEDLIEQFKIILDDILLYTIHSQ